MSNSKDYELGKKIALATIERAKKTQKGRAFLAKFWLREDNFYRFSDGKSTGAVCKEPIVFIPVESLVKRRFEFIPFCSWAKFEGKEI